MMNAVQLKKSKNYSSCALASDYKLLVSFGSLATSLFSLRICFSKGACDTVF